MDSPPSNHVDDDQPKQSKTTDEAPHGADTTTSSSSRPSRRRSSISESLRSLSLKILSIMPESLHHHHHQHPDEDVSDKTQSSSLEQEQLNEMLKQLSPEQVEIAARASYSYLKGTSTEKQDYHAKQYCLRYLRSKKNVDKAVSKLKETLAFRQEIKVDEIRTAFDDNDTSQQPEASTDSSLSFKETLRTNLASQHLYVQGYDRHGRSTYIFVPRNVRHHDAEWTIIEHVYTLERALACSKLLTCSTTTTTATDGGDVSSSSNMEPVNAIVDFTGFAAYHAPPMHIGKQFMTILRNRYVGCIHQIFLVNAPTAFLFLWSVLKHFVGKNTRDKIHFVNSKNSSNNKNLLAGYYDLDQAASWMLPSGQKNRELDSDEYLLKTPFHQAFDDERRRATTSDNNDNN
jgi:CRAL/TRIO domain